MYKRIFFFNINFNSNKQVSMLIIESENFFFEKEHWNNPSTILELKLVLNNLNNLIYMYK